MSTLDERPLLTGDPDAALALFRYPLPDQGAGASAALQELIQQGMGATIATSGPRCFHFVIGGATPASLAADWWASTLDQIAYTWVTTPLGVELEVVSLDWLKELMDLPEELFGVMTTGATMANFVALAAARQWWGQE